MALNNPLSDITASMEALQGTLNSAKLLVNKTMGVARLMLDVTADGAGIAGVTGPHLTGRVASIGHLAEVGNEPTALWDILLQDADGNDISGGVAQNLAAAKDNVQFYDSDPATARPYPTVFNGTIAGTSMGANTRTTISIYFIGVNG